MKRLVLVAALALAACSGEPADGPELTAADLAAAAADVVPAAPPPTPAPAPDIPGPVAGRWAFTESTDGATAPREGHCLLHRPTLRQAYSFYRPLNPDCPPPSFRQEGSSFVGLYECQDSRTEITITGNLASAYTMTEVITAASQTSGPTTIISIATRTGECSGQPEPPPLPDTPEPPAQ